MAKPNDIWTQHRDDGRRHRLMMFARPIAPWRRTRAEAEQDAIELRTASRERWSRTVYLTVPAWIANVPATPAIDARCRGRALPIEKELHEVADVRDRAQRHPDPGEPERRRRAVPARAVSRGRSC